MNGTLVLGSLREASRNGLGAAVLMLLMLAMVGLFSLGILASLLFSYRFLQQPLRRLLHCSVDLLAGQGGRSALPASDPGKSLRAVR